MTPTFSGVFTFSGGLEMFRHFLRTEFSDENLEFWILCQEYRTLKSSKQIAQANRIFTDFVAIQAAREVRSLIKSVECYRG